MINEGGFMKRRQQGRSIEERYKTACGNRLVCLIGVGILLILPVLGYVFHKWLSEELSFPSSEEWAYMPLNFGTYGLMGVLAILIVVLIVCTIKVLIHSIPGTGFTLFGCLLSLGATILFYGLCVSVGMGVFTCLYHLYQKIEPAIDFMIFDIHIEGGNPVFGPAGTMGVALLSTILYGALLLAVLTGAMINWMRVRKLKLPAMEERRVQEEKERAAEAE